MKWLANMEVLWFDLLQSDWLYVTSVLIGSLLQVFLLGHLKNSSYLSYVTNPWFFLSTLLQKITNFKIKKIQFLWFALCFSFFDCFSVKSLLIGFLVHICIVWLALSYSLSDWLLVIIHVFLSVSAGIPGYPEPPVIEEITTGEFEVSWLPPHDFGENITYYLLQYRYYIDSAASACLVLSKIVVAWWLVESYARAWAWLGHRAWAMGKYCWPRCKTETQPTIFIPPAKWSFSGVYCFQHVRDSVLLSTFKVFAQ